MELRPARKAEAGVIAALSRDLIETGFPWRWRRARILHRMAAADAMVVTATIGRGVAGFAVFSLGADDARLDLFAVRPDSRRRGVGRALVAWMEATLNAAGIATVRLEVRAGNAGAQHFYRRLGFRAAARASGYYFGREDAVLMAKDLHAHSAWRYLDAAELDPRWFGPPLAGLHAAGGENPSADGDPPPERRHG